MKLQLFARITNGPQLQAIDFALEIAHAVGKAGRRGEACRLARRNKVLCGNVEADVFVEDRIAVCLAKA